MNPGVTEEISKVTTATVDALKSTPIVLALVIFNVLFMLMSGYVALKVSERWDKEIDRWQTLVHACQNITVKEKQQEP